MEINGGSGLPRSSEISLVKLGSVENLASVRTSIGDPRTQSQNLVPHNSTEASAKVNGRPKLDIDELAFKRNPRIERKPRTTKVE